MPANSLAQIFNEKSKVNIEEIINLIKKTNVKIDDIFTDDGDLEDVFLLLTKN